MDQPARHRGGELGAGALAVGALCILLTACGEAPRGGAGQGVTRKLDLRLEFSRLRSGGPLPVRARFARSGTRALEGRLELVFRAGNDLLLTWRSGDLVLTSGEQAFDLLLPALDAPESDAPQVQVDGRFLTRDGPIALPTTQWLIPGAFERSCIVGVSAPAYEQDESRRTMARGLRLEHLGPIVPASQRRNLVTSTAWVRPEDMPTQPLACCQFDVVLLAGKGFAFLKARQLDALAAWVRAGGSACVVPYGPLEARHAAFLNALSDRVPPVFGLEPDGSLGVHSPPQDGARECLHFHAGLGRLAVLTEPPASADALKAPAWRRSAAFLWKIRRGQTGDVVSKGAWRPDLEHRDTMLDSYTFGGPLQPEGVEGRFHTLPLLPVDVLFSSLMPQSVQLIPLGVLVVVLVVFVFVIGPVDYFALGWLRQRRLTWLFFPLAAVGATLLTVALSNYYMGHQQHVRSFAFVDLDGRGHPVRQSRFEFLFSGSESTARHEVRRAFFHPVGRGMEMPDYYGRSRRASGSSVMGSDQGGEVFYEGRFPGRYTVTHAAPQWVPLLNRISSFEAEPPAHRLTWTARHLPGLWRGYRGSALLEGLKRQPSISSVWLLHGYAARRIWASGKAGSSNFLVAGEREARRKWPRGKYAVRGSGATLLAMASVRPQVGLFSIVSQMSPTGAGNFEDLSMLDPTDSSQWLLAVVEERDDEVVVYRRLYRSEGGDN